LCKKNEEPNYRRNISYSLATFALMVDLVETTFSKDKKMTMTWAMGFLSVP
jgi:hypothetical protein